jgi:hypothetical protein
MSWLGLKYFFLVPKDESSDSTLKEVTTMPFTVPFYCSTKVLRTEIGMASSVNLSVNVWKVTEKNLLCKMNIGPRI